MSLGRELKFLIIFNCLFAIKNHIRKEQLSKTMVPFTNSNRPPLKDPVLPIEHCMLRSLGGHFFYMSKILRLLFVARIELFNNNGCLAPVKAKTTTRSTQSIMANTGPLN